MSPFNKENELLNIYPFYNIEQNINLEQNINFIEQYGYEFENKIEKKNTLYIVFFIIICGIIINYYIYKKY